MIRISQLLSTSALLFVATLFTGCATSGYNSAPATDHDYSSRHDNDYNVTFGGQPAPASEPTQRVIIVDQYGNVIGEKVMVGGNSSDQGLSPKEAIRASQSQQKQDHREAMDRAKQAERERKARIDNLEDVVDIFGDVVKTVKRRRR